MLNLKQKGFNELQIDDILDTFIRNSVSNKFSFLKENEKVNRILDNKTISR